MQNSAEVRWFWPSPAPSALAEWFHSASVHGCNPGGGGVRIDRYLRADATGELGIKTRGGEPGVEIKGLVADVAAGSLELPFDARVQIWTKWPTAAVVLDERRLVEVRKRRWLRKFDTTGDRVVEVVVDANEHCAGSTALPVRGCNVEWTEVMVDENTWWTLGYEAFGGLDDVRETLRRVVALMNRRQHPALADGWSGSFPGWLAQHAGPRPANVTHPRQRPEATR